MNTPRVIQGSQGTTITCLTGQIFLNPNQLIGATNGVLIVQGVAIPISQPVVAGNRGLPLSQANGLFARVCGSFRFDVSGPTFVVNCVQPLLQQ